MTIQGIKFEAAGSGNAVSFVLRHKSKEYRVVVSRELLSDELSSAASFDERRKYVEDNFEKIRNASVAKIDGGIASKTFTDGISVQPA
ncbi:MAG: hypothetical protein ACRECE_01430 [Xanthobacteraceae bacterium]